MTTSKPKPKPLPPMVLPPISMGRSSDRKWFIVINSRVFRPKDAYAVGFSSVQQHPGKLPIVADCRDQATATGRRARRLAEIMKGGCSARRHIRGNCRPPADTDKVWRSDALFPLEHGIAYQPCRADRRSLAARSLQKAYPPGLVTDSRRRPWRCCSSRLYRVGAGAAILPCPGSFLPGKPSRLRKIESRYISSIGVS